MRVVATAGHVDHGKSTLVHTLTGTDPDRLAEEKARGLTIDLGFAHTTLPSGAEVAFVDVPGHVRFLRNMLAGVGAVDACLFVVAATEGWKPQSEEHLRILELLGIRHGAVALTKAALVDDDWLQLARMELDDHLAGTFLAGAEVVAVDAPTGRGIDGENGLRAALDRLVAATPEAVDRSRARLWIDRSFAAKGSGTVVTGTLTGGALAVDDEVSIVPGGLTARVRALQSHGSDASSATPGRRLAVNLAGAGIHHGAVERGQAVVHPGRWHLTARFDASLTVLSSLGHKVSRRGAHVAYLGSGEHPVRLRVLGPDAITPGETGLVRLHLPVALPLLPGDRFVLRESGRSETVGGGEVLDVAPIRPASKAAPDRRVERLVAERGWVLLGDLRRITADDGIDVRIADVGGRWVVDPVVLAATKARIMDALPMDIAALDERDRMVMSDLAERGDVVIAEGRARHPDATDPMAALARTPWLVELRAAPFSPPSATEAGVDRGLVRDLVRHGFVVERDGFHYSAEAVTAAVAILAGLLEQHPDGITVGDVRDALGTTRKHVIPLLAHLDAGGVTRRRGDLRIAGPRLPPPPEGA